MLFVKADRKYHSLVLIPDLQSDALIVHSLRTVNDVGYFTVFFNHYRNCVVKTCQSRGPLGLPLCFYSGDYSCYCNLYEFTVFSVNLPGVPAVLLLLLCNALTLIKDPFAFS
jgi:hypothetical protein